MAVGTPNMGLHEWNLTDDNFSFSDLEANWKFLDKHDHSPGKGVQLPTTAFPDSSFTNPKFAFQSLRSDRFVTTPQASSAFAPAKLMNNNFPATRQKWALAGRIDSTNAPSAGGYYVRGDMQGVSATGVRAAIIPITAADWAVSNMTTQLVLRISSCTNNTAPAVTMTWGLVAITTGGASGAWTLAAPGAFVGPQVTYSQGASGYQLSAQVAAAALPADGAYALVLTTNGPWGATAVMQFGAQIGVKWV